MESGLVGITLHFFNCTDMLVEDVTINAAPHMAITSFNGVSTCSSCLIAISIHLFATQNGTHNHSQYALTGSASAQEGGHVLRRVKFETNAPGQIFVAERDGIHESDVRRGITVEDSAIQGTHLALVAPQPAS